MKLLLEFISAFVLSGVQVYAWKRITNNKFNIFCVKTISVIIILTLISMLNFKEINIFFKTVLLVIMSIVCCKCLLKETIRNSIIIVVINYFIILVADALFGVLLLILSNSSLKDLLDKYSSSILSDVCVALIIILLLKIRYINKIYNFIKRNTSNLRQYQILILLLIIICCSASGFLLTYYKNNTFIALLINIIITFVYAVVILIVIKTKNNYIKISKKYNTSIGSLHSQEAIIRDYRIMNHETKNQLLTIKSMSNNKKVNGYIDSLLKKNNTFNDKIINDTLKLPEGGIKGIIYQKLLYMKEYNIPYHLNIDKKITTKMLLNINDDDTVDICQIMGVFIDNAIEAVQTESIKEKTVNIMFHVSDTQLVFSISNCYNKISESRNNNQKLKTTKGKNRGYGLQLVKKILSDNNKLSNETIISKDTFSQVLTINL
jgi:two-component system sensor histidine kinase AgrC